MRMNLVFAALALIGGVLCLVLDGPAATLEALVEVRDLLIYIFPQLAAGLLIGGLAQVLIDRDRAASLFGESSSFRGLALATLAGAVTPGGPFTSFPLVYALWRAGADAGTLITYLVAWALIGFHRILLWELPFMGPEFTALRVLISVPIPLVAGLTARALLRSGLFRLEREDEA